jgi:protein subunit release factor A
MIAVSSDSVIVEIRAAEGGEDAKLLVLEQRAIYLRLCTRRSL